MLNNSYLISVSRSFQQARYASFLPRAAVSAIQSTVPRPKPAANAYTIFYSEQYPEFKKQFPDFHLTELAKRIGAKWNSLSDATKKSYADKASKGQAGSKQQSEQFYSNLTPRQSLALRMIRLNTRARRGEFTRRHLSEEEQEFLSLLPAAPYLTGRAIFAASFLRKRGPGVAVTTKISELSGAWDALSASEKAGYEQQAKKDQENYLGQVKKILSE